MQFGVHTVHQWTALLDTPPTNPLPTAAAASNHIINLSSRISPPPTPPASPPASPQHTPPPSPPSPPSSPPSPVTSPSPPQPLTWAARVAAVRQPTAHPLPPPRPVALRHPSTASNLRSVSSRPIPAVPPPLPHPSPPRRRRSSPVQSPPTLVVPAPAPPPPPPSQSSSAQVIDKPQIDALPLPPRRLRGLINSGNTCFINVVLQALLACQPFRALLHACAPPPTHSLLSKFVRLAKEMSPSDTAVRSSHTVANSSTSSTNPNNHSANHSNNPTPSVTTSTNHTRSSAPAPSVPPLTDDPLLPDWFFHVFSSSSPSPASCSATPHNQSANRLPAPSSGSQEDAEEFLTFVLNGLHEELVAAQPPPMSPTTQPASTPSKPHANGFHNHTSQPALQNFSSSNTNSTSSSLAHRTHDDEDGWVEMTRNGKSVEIRGREFARSGITDIFGGALRSEVKRPRSKPSVTREPFFSLSLDIESGMILNLLDALADYFKPEILEGFPPEANGGNVGVTDTVRKHVLVQQMPQVLILHLKRFSHNTATGALNKVTRNMAFPDVLHVPGKFIHNPANRWSAESKTYELTAVVTHLGKELAGGHYTCDVRWQGEDGQDAWVTCDDSKIVRTSLQKVTRKQAYLLFYSAVKA